MRPPVRNIVSATASGLVWSGLAWILGARALGTMFIGGLIASPLIGLGMAHVTPWWIRRSVPVRVALALGVLYVAAALFGLAAGAFDVLAGTSRLQPAQAVIGSMIGVVWGLTFTGAFIVLLPLAYLNLKLLAPVRR